MIKGILFDKDGTLIEFESMWHQIMTLVYAELVDENVDKLKEISGYTQEGFEAESIIQYLNTRDIISLWMKEIRYHTSDEVFDIFEKCAVDESVEIKLLTGVKESLDYLYKKGYVLGIATADTTQSTLHNLSQCGVLDYFSFIGSDDGLMLPKPHPDMASRFISDHSFASDQLLIVGDSISDLRFSQNARADFVGIRAGYGELESLNEPVTMVNNLKEIIDSKCL